MAETDESQLFSEAKEGDRGAFSRLQLALQPSVLRFAVRLVGRYERELDIVQDAFVSLYMNLDRVSSAEHLRPYLFRIVRNLCYDELRRRGRYRHVSFDDDDISETVVAMMADPEDLPDETAQWAQVFAIVQRAMDTLPELQRQALILYAEEGLTYAQAAEAMGCDIGTIKSRIHNGRKNLVALSPSEVLSAIGIHQKEDDDD